MAVILGLTQSIISASRKGSLTLRRNGMPRANSQKTVIAVTKRVGGRTRECCQAVRRILLTPCENGPTVLIRRRFSTLA